MKKPIVIVTSIIFILVIVAILFFEGEDETVLPSEEEEMHTVSPDTERDKKNTVDNKKNPPPQTPEKILPPQKEKEKGHIQKKPEDITPIDVQDALFEQGDSTDIAILNEKEQREIIVSASLSKTKKATEVLKKYTVTWKKIPTHKIQELPKSVPLYKIYRPEEGAYDFITKIASQLGFEGVVLRISSRSFALTDMVTGKNFLFFDLYHSLLKIKNMGFDLGEKWSIDDVANMLTALGILDFPYMQKSTYDSNGEQWYRYIPRLELPILPADKQGFVRSAFEPGLLGEVNVQVSQGYMLALFANFPNIIEYGSLDLFSRSEIAKHISTHVFKKGDIEAQYPGALSQEEKDDFQEKSRSPNLDITDASLISVKCGYFLENDNRIQTLLPPICSVRGTGKLGKYSVLFRVFFAPVVGAEQES